MMRQFFDHNIPGKQPKKHALLIVEHDFLDNHVGVRRVILYYWRQLVLSGYIITLATPKNNGLYLSETISIADIDAINIERSEADIPCWTSDEPVYRSIRSDSTKASTLLRWRNRKALLEDYDISIITTPWICDLGLPDGRYTAAIVYDMVPNLMACGALSFGHSTDIYEFARQHDVGYRFFLESVENICCISNSTKNDFSDFYGLVDESRLKVVIPFDISPAIQIQSDLPALMVRPRILLVNILDPRKNFAGVADAIKRVAVAHSFDVDIVGRERMELSAVLGFLENLKSRGVNVNWYSSVSDRLLDHCYSKSNLLIFPSFYEGLGLPILEAQAHGVPVISSDSSSCSEINLNSSLCVDPHNSKDLAQAIGMALDNPNGYLHGSKLNKALVDLISQVNKLPFLEQPELSGEANDS